MSRDPNESVLQSDEAHKGQSVWCPFKCLSSCRCPSVKEMTSELLLCGLSFMPPHWSSVLSLNRWMSSARLFRALLHKKKMIIRRWSCCCCRHAQLLLCVKNKLVFMTDTHWLSYLINIHAWNDCTVIRQPYLHLSTLGLLTQRNYIFISYTQNEILRPQVDKSHRNVVISTVVPVVCLWMMHDSCHPQLTGAAVLIQGEKSFGQPWGTALVGIIKLSEIERSAVARCETSFHPWRTEGEGDAGQTSSEH